MLWAGLMAGIVPPSAQASALEQCARVAAECRQRGGDQAECQRKVDACMSDNACEEVYLSCLELMEVEETLTEEACKRKRDECKSKRAQ